MYTNITLLCLPNGIPIIYNGHEHNIETVWAFTESKKVVQHFTFETTIHPNQEILTKEIEDVSKKQHINLDSGFLFYSFRYQISFAHYISQTLPYLTQYIKNYPHLKLLIPAHTYNTLQKDILTLLKIPRESILLLEDGVFYTIKTVIKPAPYPVCPPNPANEEQLWIYQQLRNRLYITPNISPHRKIYLKRDGIANSIHGNSESGHSRTILNSDSLEKMLQQYGFEMHTVGTKTLEEKYNTLKDADIIISQLGANCTNFLFTNAPNHVLLLSNTQPIGEHYYIPLCQQLNQQTIDYTVFYYNTVNEYADSTNSMNGPYNVDIEQIRTWIEKHSNS